MWITNNARRLTVFAFAYELAELLLGCYLGDRSNQPQDHGLSTVLRRVILASGDETRVYYATRWFNGRPLDSSNYLDVGERWVIFLTSTHTRSLLLYVG